ncbi:MAG: nucleotidyltransferase domain-containing protein [Candidatus Edwardsbacteria bacterium]
MKVEIVKALQENLGTHFRACALFGSFAKENPSPQSDIDLLVVTKELEQDRIKRRVRIYRALKEVKKKLGRDFSIVDLELEELKDLTLLLVNIAEEGIILYDQEKELTRLFQKIKSAVEKAGLVRYNTKDGKYGWKPQVPLRRDQRIVLKLEG